MFARNIWDKIITNRDLDLPSQQQLLAQFRCDEIGKSIFDGFTEKMKTVKPILESGKVSDEFGSMGTKAYEESLGASCKITQRCTVLMWVYSCFSFI